MTGELHDWSYPDEPPQYFARQTQAGYVMISALCWLGFYYLVIKPFKFFVPSQETINRYNDTGLDSRFPMFFATWREYENIQ